MEENRSCLDCVAVVLPSLNPDHRFKAVVDGLIEAGFRHIVIVNDGSDFSPQLSHFIESLIINQS